MKAIQNGGLVIVRSDGHKVASYNAVVLAKEWLALGEKAFAARYGFEWTPTKWTREEAARQMKAR